MADQKKEIKFNRSMIGDKRNENFAYLRKGIFNSDTPGLYPTSSIMQDYPQSVLTSTDSLLDINGDPNSGLKVIVQGASNVNRFYPLGSDAPCNNDFTGNISAVTRGFNITINQEGLFFVDETTDKVYSANYQNANHTEVGTFPSSPSVSIGGYDGLNFWWVGSSKIWKQFPEQTPFLAFSNAGFVGLKAMAFYEDQIIFFTQKDNDIYVYFWDKTSSVGFIKTIIIKNSIFVGGGVVDDTLMLIRSIYDYSNQKERRGKMIVSAWTGISFKELNSIPTGRGNVVCPGSSLSGTNCRCNNEYMILSVDNNDAETKNADLYVNYVYKIYKDGAIETLGSITNGSTNFVSIVNFALGFHAFGVLGNPPKVYTDEDNSTNWSGYYDYNDSTYITNFYCNPFNYHRLESINISFEKLFRNTDLTPDVDEELDLYYRVSDRLDWTLLGTVTAQKVIDNVNKRLDQTTIQTTVPVNEQRYQITKMPDGSALPEFNEIQFKFLSKNGFSVIGAWFEYSYITRNMIK